MHVGMATVFQNPGQQGSDRDVCREELRLADLPQYGTDTMIEYFMNLQVWGTLEECYEKIPDVNARTGNSHFVGVFSYAGMPYEEAEDNIRLFAREVMPELQKLEARTAAGRVAAPTEDRVNVGLLGS
jgi:hypothetical protein